MRVTVLAVLCLIVLAIVMAVLVAFVMVVQALAAPLIGPRFATYLGILALPLAWYLPWRWLAWPRPYVVVGQTEIDAPPSRVWQEVMLRERDDHYQRALPIVRAVDAEAGRFAMSFDDRAQVEDDPAPDLQIQIDEVEPERRLKYHVLNAHEMPLFAKDHVASEFEIEPLDGGTRSRVTLRETLKKLHLIAFVMLVYLNPCRDSMASLKVRIEGGEDRSWIATEVEAGDSLDGQSPASEEFLKALAVVAAVLVGGLALLLWFTFR